MDQIANTTEDAVVGGVSLAVSQPIETEVSLDPDEEAAGRSQPRFVRRRWPARAPVHVSLVIPAMNEEHNIPWVLERLPADIDEVILVDGDSVDNTVAVSRQIRPDIRVIGQERPGKGAALRAGFTAARGDVIVMIDADRSMDPAEIDRFLALIGEGYDLVKGSRFMGDGGTTDMEFVRRCGNAALRGCANRLYGTRFTDLCYGFMAFRREHLSTLALESDGFEIETEIVVRSVKTGLRIGEVASFEQPRAHGESNLNTWRDGARVLRAMLRQRVSRSQSKRDGVFTSDSPAAKDVAPAMADASA